MVAGFHTEIEPLLDVDVDYGQVFDGDRCVGYQVLAVYIHLEGKDINILPLIPQNILDELEEECYAAEEERKQ